MTPIQHLIYVDPYFLDFLGFCTIETFIQVISQINSQSELFTIYNSLRADHISRAILPKILPEHKKALVQIRLLDFTPRSILEQTINWLDSYLSTLPYNES